MAGTLVLFCLGSAAVTLVALRDGRLYDWGPPEEVVTEQLLADVFEVEATVERDPELRIHPTRALSGDGD